MPRTHAPRDYEQGSPGSRSDTDFADSQSALSNLRWKPGTELPKLLESNAAVVQLCRSILDGTVVELPSIQVTDAVAIQVYRLVFKSRVLSSVLPSN